MRLLSFSSCSLFVFLLSFHSLFVVMAVPLALNSSNTSRLERRGQKLLEILISQFINCLVETGRQDRRTLQLEQFELIKSGRTCDYRLRLSRTEFLEPFSSENIHDNTDIQWRFRFVTAPNQLKPSRAVSTLGVFKGVTEQNEISLLNWFTSKKAVNVNALADVTMDDLDSLPEPNTPTTGPSSLPPGITFERSPSDSYAWQIFHDSKIPGAAAFQAKYDHEPKDWRKALKDKLEAEKKGSSGGSSGITGGSSDATGGSTVAENPLTRFNAAYSHSLLHENEP
ncbi:hypothetical protein EV361DRAFT_223750 [Lentinula raphanica]|nr:hypothetical protein EV361DRAFT_223750 [Lentinula raphanica]